jgi:hypothetical protein
MSRYCSRIGFFWWAKSLRIERPLRFRGQQKARLGDEPDGLKVIILGCLGITTINASSILR